jgi:hypothetical protein
VVLIVAELPFLSPLQKLIGEAIHPFSLGNFTGIGITLLLRYLGYCFR